MAYDVFLSHNSKDKRVVVAMAEWLRLHGVSYFLDSKDLLPGARISQELGRAIEASKSAIICLGPEGEGPWQGEEMDSLLAKAIATSQRSNEFRIIPVLLPDADTTSLTWFLQTRLWIDLSGGVTGNEAELFRLRHAILGTTGDAPPLEDPKFNPYLGLKAFQKDDADFFFGRSRECTALAAMVRDWRFACIIGPSGNGKSSLARAGLATTAAKAECPGIETWTRLFVVPGNDLLRSILGQLASRLPAEDRPGAVAAALQRVLPDPAQATPETWATGLAQELEATFPDPDARVLLVVDQLEEVFTHRGLAVTTEEQRQGRNRLVLGGLAALASLRDPRWHLVITMRDDFYQRCRVSDPFWALISSGRLGLRLDELNEEGWRAAIKGPAARAGAYLEAGLVETMLRDVYRQRGSMPLLQLALQQLWIGRRGACLTHAAYTSLGGVADALQKQAEKTLRLLREEDAAYLEIARNLFLRLVSLGEGVSDTRRRMPRHELEWEGADRGAIERVLLRLSDPENRLIVQSSEAVEVTHEVLIRQGDTIRGWVEAARPEIPTLRRLTHAARRWEDNGRDPIFLNAADPPRELKLWFKKKTLLVTTVEREYWQASRASRAQSHVEKRSQRRKLADAEKARVADEQRRLKEDADDQRRAAERERQAAERERQSKVRLVYVALAAASLALIAGYAALVAYQKSQSEKLAAELARQAQEYANRNAERANQASGMAREAEEAARRSAKEALALARQAEEARNAQNLQIAEVNMNLAQQALGQNLPSSEVSPIKAVWRFLQAAKASQDANRPTDRDNALLAAQFTGGWLQTTVVHGGVVNGVLRSSDGTRLITWGENGAVRRWRWAESGQQAVGEPMKHEGSVVDCIFSSDEKRILSWSSDGTAHVWDAESGMALGAPMKHTEHLLGATFVRNGERVVTWSYAGSAYLWDAKTGDRIGQPMVHGDELRGLELSADGQRFLTWGWDGMLLWDADSARPIGKPEKRGRPLRGARFSADATRIVTWGADGARLWNAESGEPADPGAWDSRQVEGVILNRHATRIVTWGAAGLARLWGADGPEFRKLAEHAGSVRGACFNAAETNFLTWGDDSIRIWAAEDGKAVGEEMRHEGRVSNAEFVREGAAILSRSYDGTARLWDASGRPIGLPMRHEVRVEGAKLSADGRWILTWSADGTACLWDASSGRRAGPMMRHEKEIKFADFSKSQTRVVTVSADGTVRWWNFARGRLALPPMKHEKSINGVLFIGDGSRILSMSADGKAFLWNAADGTSVGQPMDLGEGGLIGSAGGKYILSYRADGTVQLWEGDGRRHGPPLKLGDSLHGAEVSDDGKHIVTCDLGEIAKLWDVESGAVLAEFQHEGQVTAAGFSPDQKRIITLGNDNTARLWDATSYQSLREPMRHEAPVGDASFSSDQQWILTGDWDGVTSAWKVGGGEAVGRPMVHGSNVNGVSFSNDQKSALTCSRDGTARLWEISSGKTIGQPMRHGASVYRANFNKDESQILTVCEDRAARLWSASNQTLIASIGGVNTAIWDPTGKRILTCASDGTVAMWDMTLDSVLTLEDRILEFEVRSASQLGADGDLQILSASEWEAKCKKWAEVRERLKAQRPGR